MTEKCNHKWEDISTDTTKEEWVSGLGDNPKICRKCGSIRRGDLKPPGGTFDVCKRYKSQ